MDRRNINNDNSSTPTWLRCSRSAVVAISASAMIGLAMTTSGVDGGSSLRGSVTRRGLQGAVEDPTTTRTAATMSPSSPACASLSVPIAAGTLAGIYTHDGRFNGGRPVYSQAEAKSKMFAQAEGARVTWYITADRSTFFLSLESDVDELAELADVQPLQQWTRNNDPECPATTTPKCTVDLLIGCTVWNTDISATEAPTSSSSNDTRDDRRNDTVLATPAPTYVVTPSPTARPRISLTPSPTASPTAAPMTADPDIYGCQEVSVANGGERSGIYIWDETFANHRPVYKVVPGSSDNRTDLVFSTPLNVCVDGWGAVNATWLENEGELGADATADEAFLHYVAGLNDPTLSGADGCTVNVWLVAGGDDVTRLESVAFLAVAEEDDPTEVTLWAKYTPANTTSTDEKGVTIANNFWVEIGCAANTEVVAAMATSDAAGSSTDGSGI